MKIAIVSPYPPSKTTLNEYAFHLINQFKTKKEVSEIVILSDELPEGQEYQNVEGECPVRIRTCWSFNSLKNLFTIRKAIKEEQPDVVLYNVQFLSFGSSKIAATLGLLSPLVSRLSGTPSVTLLHNIVETVDYESAGITKNSLMKWIFNMAGTVMTKIILGSNLVGLTMPKYVNIIEKKYGAKNVALLPHGSFETPPVPSFEIPKGKKQIMTFGKFGTYKKVEKMIEAVELVRERTGEELEIVVAGTDNPNVKGYLENVEKTYSHVPDMRFTGYVEEEDVATIFGDSAVVVFPYTSTTGSSGVLHQAGAYGKAVVMPNIGDLKELIEEEGYAGEFFEPDNVEDMADAIQKLVVDEDHRTKIAEKNYAAAASLPMDDIADWYLMHFETLSKQKRKTSKKYAKQLKAA